MATHLQGITDTIPGLIPWQPDSDFYRTALQYKEQQYEAGYQKVNSIYNSIFNSPVSHADSVKRRDKALQDIDFQLKKAAKLDLSKRENIESARKIFQPLLNDKHLIKDIAFTKAYNNQINRANRLRDCVGANCPDEYWEEGVQELMYKMDEFVSSPYEGILAHQNPRYTPYYNVYKEGMGYLKELGFQAQNISKSPDGRYIIHTTNGEQVIPDLVSLMTGAFGNNQKAMDVSKTLAYLQRKQFVSSHADLYGGEEQAEQEYFRKTLNNVARVAEDRALMLEAQEKQIVGQKKILDYIAKNRSKTPLYPDDVNLQSEQAQRNFEQIQESKRFNESTLAMLNPKNLDPQNVRAFGAKIDYAYANELLTGQLQSVAHDYAMLTRKEKVEADPYELALFKHSLQLELAAFKQALKDEQEVKETNRLLDLAHFSTGVPTDGGTGQSTTDFNLNDTMVVGYNEASGRAANVAAESLVPLFNSLNHKYKTETDPNQKAYWKGQIEAIFGNIETYDPNREKVDRSQKFDLMSEAWYEYANSLIGEERERFMKNSGLSQLGDVDPNTMKVRLQGVAGDTQGIMNQGVKGVAKDIQDMVRRVEKKGADWDSDWFTRTFYYGKGWGPKKEDFQNIIKLYNAKLAAHSSVDGRGYVTERDGELRFNANKMRNMDALVLQPQDTAVHPSNAMNTARDFLRTPTSRSLFTDDPQHSNFKSKFDNDYHSYTNAMETREIYAEAQKQNNITVVDYLASGAGGVGNAELWSKFGKYFLDSQGNVVDRDKFNNSTKHLFDLHTYHSTSANKLIYDKFIKGDTYDKLHKEFYGAYHSGLPNIQPEILASEYNMSTTSGGAGMLSANGLTYGYDGRLIGVEGDHSVNRFMNFIDRDLSRIISDGSTNFFIGSASNPTQIEPGEEEAFRSIFKQIQTEVLTDRTADLKSPSEQRPKFTYTIYDIADQSVSRRALTINLDQHFIKRLSDSKTQGVFEKVFGSGKESVTMTFTKPYGEELFSTLGTPDYTKAINLRAGEPYNFYKNDFSGNVVVNKNNNGYVINGSVLTPKVDESGNIVINSSGNPIFEEQNIATSTVTNRQDLNSTLARLRTELDYIAYQNRLELSKILLNEPQ